MVPIVEGSSTTFAPTGGDVSVLSLTSVPVLPDGSSVLLENGKSQLFIWTPSSSVANKNGTILFLGPAGGVLRVGAIKPSGSPVLTNEESAIMMGSTTVLLPVPPCAALPNGSYYIGLTWTSSGPATNATYTISSSISDFVEPPSAVVGSSVASPPSPNQPSLYRLPFNSSFVKQAVLIPWIGNGVISSLSEATTPICTPPGRPTTIVAASGLVLPCQLFNSSAYAPSAALYLATSQPAYTLNYQYLPVLPSNNTWTTISTLTTPSYFYFGDNPADYPMTVIVNTPSTSGGADLYVHVFDPAAPYCDVSKNYVYGLRNYTYTLTCPKIFSILRQYGSAGSTRVLAFKPSGPQAISVQANVVSSFDYRPQTLFSVSNPSQLYLQCVGSPVGIMRVQVPLADGTCKRTTMAETVLCDQANLNTYPYDAIKIYGVPSNVPTSSVFVSPHDEARIVNYTWVPAQSACDSTSIFTRPAICEDILQYPLARVGFLDAVGLPRWTVEKDLAILPTHYPSITPGSTCFEAVRRYSCLSLVPQCEPASQTLIRFPEVCNCNANLRTACPQAHQLFIDELCRIRTSYAPLCAATAQPPAPTPFTRPGSPTAPPSTSSAPNSGGSSPSSSGSPANPAPPTSTTTTAPTKISGASSVAASLVIWSLLSILF